MTTNVKRHGRWITLIHQGVAIRMQREDWKTASVAIHQEITAMDEWLAVQHQKWAALFSLDQTLREQGVFDALRDTPVVLENGQYVFLDRQNFSLLWHIVSATNPNNDHLNQLWIQGCFDLLLLQDPNLPVQSSTTMIGRRLQQLSEMMQWMPAGDGIVGDESLDAWDFEMPQHTVTLDTGIWIGSTPVTQQLYAAIMPTMPDLESLDQGALRPMINISWWDALLFCNRLSLQANRRPVYRIGDTVDWGGRDDLDIASIQWDRSSNGYRLLTEAEWELAARALQPHEYAGSSVAAKVAWTDLDDVDRLPLVRQKQSNAMELYDMSGLVWEWCWDAYDATFYHTAPSLNPSCDAPLLERVCRGGSFVADPANSRVSMRGRTLVGERWNRLGFRIACAD